MKKRLIVGALALLTTLSFAAEKLGTQNFAPEALEKIKTFKTTSPMSPNKVSDMDAALLVGLAYSNKSAFVVLSDYFWSTKCTNDYENISTWVKDYQDTPERRKKTAILMRLQVQADTNPDAKQAYKAIILSERIANCGSDDDVVNFVELIK